MGSGSWGKRGAKEKELEEPEEDWRKTKVVLVKVVF